MKLFYKIIGVFIGTMIMGFGVAMFDLSSLGFDALSALVISLQNLIHVTYSLAYILLNLIFLIFMIIFLRNQIGIGTIINYLFTGIFCDIFMFIFKLVNLNHSHLLIINIIYGLIGVLLLALGIAIYANANLGLTPYDSIPIIITKYVRLFNKPIKFHFARKIIDGVCLSLALVIGILILKQTNIIGINTIIPLIVIGYLVSFFSKIVNKYIYKTKNDMFN